MSAITMHRPSLSILVIVCIFLSTGCSDSADNNSPKPSQLSNKPTIAAQPEQNVTTPDIESLPAITQFIEIVEKHLLLLIERSQHLNQSLINFAKKPSKDGLTEVINDLEKTHSLFISGYFLDTCCLIYTTHRTHDDAILSPIDIKTSLDQQPLLPGYLDVVDGYPFSGLIYSDIPITRNHMEQEFQLGDPAYVTLGFHALEVILKGSNLKRKASDFSALTSTSDSSEAPPELRRTLYAILLATEIEKDISTIKYNWDLNLRAKLQQKTSSQAKDFLKQLNLNIEKALHKQSNDEAEHFNAESLSLKQALLEELASLKDL